MKVIRNKGLGGSTGMPASSAGVTAEGWKQPGSGKPDKL
jgi:hypothetical protein